MNILFLTLLSSGFSLNNLSIEKQLPPMNNIYSSTFNIPFIGKQNIEYERNEKFTSTIRLKGLINEKGFIYFDKYDIYNYNFDDNIKKILKKYKCELIDPSYDKENDIIIIKVKIYLLKFGKTLIFKKINTC